MEKKVAILALLISLLALPPLLAEEPLTLDQAVAIALKKNPDIAAALKRYEAAKARIKQAKAFSEPEIYYESDFLPRFYQPKEAGETLMGITQTIEFPGKRIVRGKAATADAEVVKKDYEALKRELIAGVKTAFYRILFAEEEVRYAQENLKLARDFLRMAKLRFEAGSVAKFEVLRARVEEAKARNELKVAENDLALAKAELNFLLARDMNAPLSVAGELKAKRIKYTLSELTQRAYLVRPEIQGLQFAIKREEYTKSLAKMSYLPDFSLRIGSHRVLGERNYWDVEFGLNIPLFFWQRQQGEIAEANANLQSLLSELQSTKNRISLEVKNAYLNVMALSERIKLYEREILVEAEEVYRIAIRSYEEGEVGNLEVLEARRTLIGAKISYAQVLFEYNAALAELEKAVGESL